MDQTAFDSILSARADPLDVLSSTAPVVQQAQSVRIDSKAVIRSADQLATKQAEPPPWNYDLHFFDASPRTVNYLFLLDSLNFCFWGRPRWAIPFDGKRLDGYWALAASLKRGAKENPRLLDADYLAQLSPEDLAQVLRGSSTIPLFVERWRSARELGTVLRDRWKGQAAGLVESAQGDAARLAQSIVDNFCSFDDTTVYAGREVRFFKRAQILVADLWGAFGGKAWGQFRNVDVLTAFADYKLPQIMRAWGILRYAPALARRVDGKKQLASGSPEEVEIRAATLWAVEFLRVELGKRGRALLSTQVDWILWEASQTGLKGKKPYHRVRTIYY